MEVVYIFSPEIQRALDGLFESQKQVLERTQNEVNRLCGISDSIRRKPNERGIRELQLIAEAEMKRISNYRARLMRFPERIVITKELTK